MQNYRKGVGNQTKYSWLLLFVLTCFSAFASGTDSPVDLSELQESIIDIQKSANIPALGIVVVDKNQPVWVAGLGKTNLVDGVVVDAHTKFPVGSISKMFVGLAVLKLVEEGKLSLNDKVRDLVPEITFENKWRNTHPVLLVHLLEHTSGWGDMTLPEFAHNQIEVISLRESLTKYTDNRKSRWPAGTRHAYSNIGIAVAGYVVEKVSGVSFEEYVEHHFFKPLDMNHSTYFPSAGETETVTTYIRGISQKNKHILYRPSGALNISPAEAANFLTFLVQRGRYLGNELLSSDSLLRMRTAKTTLGSGKGLTAGYGLTSYSSGFGKYSTAFYGHDGSINGATASLAYIPSLNSGYVVMSSGNGAAMYQIAQLIRGYLLRNSDPYKKDKNTALPSEFKALNGYYKKVNSRNKFEGILNDFVNMKVVSSLDNVLDISSLFGQHSIKGLPFSNSLLADPRSGLPSIAIVNDPVLGELLQVENDLYQNISKWEVWSRLVLLISALVLTLASLLYTLFWLPLHFYRKKLTKFQVSCRLWPAFAGIAFIVFIILLVLANGRLSDISLLSPLSLSIWAVSLGYPLVVFIALYQLWKRRVSPFKSKGYWFGCLICTVHLCNVFLLASYGMIGFKIWLFYHI